MNVKVAMIRPGDKSELQLNVLNCGQGTGFQDVSHADYIDFLRSWAGFADTTAADTEVERLRRDNEMLRRQVAALMDGIIA